MSKVVCYGSLDRTFPGFELLKGRSVYSVLEQMILTRVGMVSLGMSALHKRTSNCPCASAEENKPIKSG